MENHKKKALCIATVASNLDNFNRSNVKLLQELGYEVTLAANFHADEDSSPKEKIDSFIKEMRLQDVLIRQIDFSRHLGKIGKQIRSIRQVKELLKQEHFDLIHCHTPIASVLTRAIANKYRKKNGTKVLYTAHGFHFFQGAPRKNWLIYYPAEKWASRFTDTLITINEEDYQLALEKFHAGKVIRIPGIGVDTERFGRIASDTEIRRRKREELGIKLDEVALISVGELNTNKNHALAMRALAKVKEENPSFLKFCYLICGQGEEQGRLESLARETGLDKNVRFLGFRRDIAELLAASDIFLFPSKREGLPLSLMEAMASGLPAVVTDVRGNRELVKENETGYVRGFTPEEFAEAISRLLSDEELQHKMGSAARNRILNYDTKIVREQMKTLYSGV